MREVIMEAEILVETGAFAGPSKVGGEVPRNFADGTVHLTTHAGTFYSRALAVVPREGGFGLAER